MVDWNEYQLNFPKRYFEHSYFDEKVELFLHNYDIKTALDIGGGISGQINLKMSNIDTWLLDPYVDCDSWMKGKITWNSHQIFDLVIARGSINYLNTEQISKIPEFGKYFLANSFDKPPSVNWSERSFSTLQGKKGKERFRYNPDLNSIEHELEFIDKTIKHIFFYYTQEQFKQMLPNIIIEKYAKNSILLIGKDDFYENI